MLLTNIRSALLLSAALSGAATSSQLSDRSSRACNNSPLLCHRAYDKVTYLGAHDSPFLRDAATDFTESGNQFYNSSVQLSAGVRLLTAQVQLNGDALHVCHSSCDLLDAGTLSSWLAEVRTWMASNPDEVVTILLVNGASASVSSLAGQYSAAGITEFLAYTPSGTSAQTEDWPTLDAMIDSGKRLVNFVDYIGDNSAAPYIMPEFDYIFENQYDVVSLDGFSCDANRPPSAIGQTEQVVSNGVMPLMNHFLYQNDGFGIQSPNEGNITTTNSPDDAVGSLGSSATQCKETYGRAPTYLLVDFFNVGPAISTADRLNGVTHPVGRTQISTEVLTATSSAGLVVPGGWKLCLSHMALSFAILSWYNA